MATSLRAWRTASRACWPSSCSKRARTSLGVASGPSTAGVMV